MAASYHQLVKAELVHNENKSMLMDMTVFVVLLFTVPVIYSYSHANQGTALPEWIEAYPYYLIIYLFHFVLPIFCHLCFVTLFYFRNPSAVTFIKREVKEMYDNIRHP